MKCLDVYVKSSDVNTFENYFHSKFIFIFFIRAYWYFSSFKQINFSTEHHADAWKEFYSFFVKKNLLLDLASLEVVWVLRFR